MSDVEVNNQITQNEETIRVLTEKVNEYDNLINDINRQISQEQKESRLRILRQQLSLYEKQLKTTKTNISVLKGLNATLRSSVQSNVPSNVPKVPSNNLGFTETIKRSSKTRKTNVSPNICANIFMNGSKTKQKYFYPSQFPNLTKLKSISYVKKGGKTRRKKRVSTYIMRRY